MQTGFKKSCLFRCGQIGYKYGNRDKGDPMKVVNLLDGTAVEMASILAIYTGPLQGLNHDAALAPDVFEASIHDRILPRDLVLHEVNLLPVGYMFWIKIEPASGDGMVWLPAKMMP
jgi:hypothetical protein